VAHLPEIPPKLPKHAANSCCKNTALEDYQISSPKPKQVKLLQENRSVHIAIAFFNAGQAGTTEG
jgi:hypothetical protein